MPKIYPDRIACQNLNLIVIIILTTILFVHNTHAQQRTKLKKKELILLLNKTLSQNDSLSNVIISQEDILYKLKIELENVQSAFLETKSNLSSSELKTKQLEQLLNSTENKFKDCNHRQIQLNDSIVKLNSILNEKIISINSIKEFSKKTIDSLKERLSVNVVMNSNSYDKESGINVLDYYQALVSAQSEFIKADGGNFYNLIRDFLFECEVHFVMCLGDISFCKYDLCYQACYDLISIFRPIDQYDMQVNYRDYETERELEIRIKNQINKVLCNHSSTRESLKDELTELWTMMREFVFENPYTCIREVLSDEENFIVVVADLGGNAASIVTQKYLIEKNKKGTTLKKIGATDIGLD